MLLHPGTGLAPLPEGITAAGLAVAIYLIPIEQSTERETVEPADPPRVYAQPIRLTFTPDVLAAMDRIIEVYNVGQRTIRRGGNGLYTRSSLLRELVMLEAARLIRDGKLQPEATNAEAC